MHDETENFLESYKRLETALRNSDDPMSVAEYENYLTEKRSEPETADKLKVCRIIRNYLQHHPDGSRIFKATPAMTGFVAGLADVIEARKQKMSDIMIRQKPVTFADTLQDIIQSAARSKAGYAVIVNNQKEYIGILTSRNIIGLTAKYDTNKKLTDILTENRLKKMSARFLVFTASPDEPAETAYTTGTEHIIILKDRKYKGIVR